MSYYQLIFGEKLGLAAFRFLYEKVLHPPRADLRVPARRKLTRRACVYSTAQVAKRLATARNPKHRALGNVALTPSNLLPSGASHRPTSCSTNKRFAFRGQARYSLNVRRSTPHWQIIKTDSISPAMGHTTYTK